MPSFDDLEFTGVVARSNELRPAVIPQRRDLRQRGQHIHLSQRQRSLPDSPGLRRNRRTQLSKQSPFDLDNLFLRIENFGFVFLQLRSGEALGAYQSLLAFIILRNQVQIRLRDLEVIAEDGVELYLKRSNAGPPALPLLDLGQHLLAVARELAQLVQITIQSRGNHAAIGKTQRRLRHNRLVDTVAQVAEFVESSV